MGSILNPTTPVVVNGTTVEVRELRAVDGLQFIQKLSAYFGSFKKIDSEGTAVAEVASLTIGATDLSEFLVLRSTGKQNAWLEEISFSDFFDVLSVAIQLNITEGLIKKARGVVDEVRGRISPSTPSNGISPG